MAVRVAPGIGFLIVVLLVALLAASATVGIPASVQWGKVVDNSTGTPLSGVRVVAIDTGMTGYKSPSLHETVTNSLGKYSLSLWGEAWVLYEASGYESLRLVYPHELVDCDSCCGRLKDVTLNASH
jgi:hypothetical protein